MTEWTPPSIVGDANALSQELQDTLSGAQIPIADQISSHDWVLLEHNGALILKRPDGVSQSVNFTHGKSRHRRSEADAGAGPLRKALGLSQFLKRHQRMPTIIDATGGWGQDAWVFASLECQVIILEKHPVVHLLLANGLSTASTDNHTQLIEKRITLFNQDSTECLKKHTADVIYLDPMYPHRSRKKADSKKGMQFLQALLGPTDESISNALFDAAAKCKPQRIVVKRPKGADALVSESDIKMQSYSVESPNTRYDIYQSLPSTESHIWKR